MNYWYIARSRPGKDPIAKGALKARGYTVFRPVMPAKRKHADPDDPAHESMFPGYLFARPHVQGWENLRNAPGMTHPGQALLRLSGGYGEIARFSDESRKFLMILATQERIWRKFSEDQGIPWAEFRHKPESPLKVEYGACLLRGVLSGHWAIIETLDEVERIKCLFDEREFT